VHIPGKPAEISEGWLGPHGPRHTLHPLWMWQGSLHLVSMLQLACPTYVCRADGPHHQNEV
jgi:hypothetical protein